MLYCTYSVAFQCLLLNLSQLYYHFYMVKYPFSYLQAIYHDIYQLSILFSTILYWLKSKQSVVVRLLTNKENDRRDRLPALNSAQLRLEMDNFNFIFYQTFPFSFSLRVLPGWSWPNTLTFYSARLFWACAQPSVSFSKVGLVLSTSSSPHLVAKETCLSFITKSTFCLEYVA